MPLFPEFTIAAALVGVLVLYILTRFFNSRPRYLARKTEILDKFQVLRYRSKTLQDELSHYLLSGADGNEYVWENITYKDLFKQVQRNHKENLSDKNYARIKKTHNRVTLMQARKMLDEQETLLGHAEHKLNSK
jgi:hypothetical protein